MNGATVNFRWGAALQRLSCAVARLDLSSSVNKEHIDYAHSILVESLTTKEPNMVNEGGTGLGQEQSKVMDEIMRLLEDWSIMELDRKNLATRRMLMPMSRNSGNLILLIMLVQKREISILS